jgi:ribonuclease P protein component
VSFFTKLQTLKTKQDFKTVLDSSKIVSSSFVIYYKKNIDKKLRFGFIVSKKIGNAVHRNYAKRRLRHLSQKYILNSFIGLNIVWVARNGISKNQWNKIEIEMLDALRKLK